MTQEDKELLLKDLCARLPYGVKAYSENVDLNGTVSGLSPYSVFLLELHDWWDIEFVRPYLRPISSMTEKEKKEAKENGCIIYWDTSPEDKGLLVFASPKGFDWLNKKMFDYRKDDEGKTMIEKGLALEAPEGMYNN